MSSTQNRHRRRMSAAAATIALSLAVAGCASPAQDGSGASDSSSGVTLNASLIEAATTKAASLGEGLGGSLEVIGGSGGAEGAILEAVYAPFSEATGVKINYTGTKDVLSIVQSRVQAGNAPDIAEVGLGVATDYAAAGDLVALDDIIPAEELANYPAGLLDNARYDGSLFAVFPAVNNYMVWFNPEQYSGPTDPASWSELTDWTNDLAAAGSPAWCIAEEAGAGSGFPGSQFIENLFLKKYGSDLYGQWGRGELEWTSPEVKDAWQMFGQIATDDSKVAGGVTGSLAASIATGSNGLIDDPATCESVLWGTWVPGLIGDGVDPGVNLDFFPVPASNPEYADEEVFIANPMIAFNDTPQVHAFMQYLASTEAEALLASADHWTVANTAVPVDTYNSPLLQKASETFFGGDVSLAAGPMVLAGGDVLSAFYKGVVSYLQEPDSLDSVLATVQAAQDAH